MPLAPTTQRCDIIIPVYDQVDYTRACVESILARTTYPFRLIIVDDASRKEETRDYLMRLQQQEPERVLLLHNTQNVGYVGTVNHGLQQATADHVVVMNNDTIVYDGWLAEMITIAEKDPSIGIVNPQWEVPKRYARDRDRYFRRQIVPQKGRFIETDWARGFCYLTKRCVIDRIGGLDEDFAPAYYDDWDYSLRAREAGYRCVRALGAFVYHYCNVTYASDGNGERISGLLAQKGELFHRRWGKPLKVLMVDDGAIGAIEGKLRRFLRDQSRVRVVSPVPVGITHTNLSVVMVPRCFMVMAVLLLLLDDRRHAEAKRWHLILGSERMLSYVKKVPLFSKHYRLVDLPEKDESVLNELIRSMKFR